MSTQGIRGFYRGYGSTIMREVRIVLLALITSRLTQAFRSPSHHYSSLCTSCLRSVSLAFWTDRCMRTRQLYAVASREA